MKTPKVIYSYDELVAAFTAWVKTQHIVNGVMSVETLTMNIYKPRMDAWESYCDVRDGLPRGTTQARRISATRPRLVAVAGVFT